MPDERTNRVDSTTVKEVVGVGSTSMGVLLTKELKRMGVEKGEFVEISIRRVR